MNEIRPTEEAVFNLQTGIGEVQIPLEEKHFFDITGYLVLEDLLTENQVAEAQSIVARAIKDQSDERGDLPGHPTLGRNNIAERGGVVEDAMALPVVLDRVHQFIWGKQYRLIGSRAILNVPGMNSRLTQGGQAAPRRYAKYRCFNDGQFRCLMITALIALSDTSAGNGAFCVIPASHKANLPHPYESTCLDTIGPLKPIPLRPGSGVLYTESVSYGFKPPADRTDTWLNYMYGPSYMLNWPGCEPSSEWRDRVAHDQAKSHLVSNAYYHPTDL